MIQIDMPMPKSCFECKFKLHGTCSILIKSTSGVRDKRLDNCPLKEADDQNERRKESMDEYMVTVTTGVVGYEFEEIIEAESDKEAREKALNEVENKLKYMKNHLEVVKIIRE